ncbi:MAG: YtxH domain-containing protein [Bacillota bacterium]|jgi:gas vesicle protein
MRRGLLTGLVIGGIIGAYYGMNMSSRDQRRLRESAGDLLDRGGEVVDRVKDGALRFMDNWR